MTGSVSTSHGPDLVEVAVDADVCIGIGACVAAEPDAFVLGDDGVTSVVPGVLLPRDRADQVLSGCPSGAISILDEPQA